MVPALCAALGHPAPRPFGHPGALHRSGSTGWGGGEQKVDLVTWCSQDSHCDRVRGSDHEAITSLGPLVSWTPPLGCLELGGAEEPIGVRW